MSRRPSRSPTGLDDVRPSRNRPRLLAASCAAPEGDPPADDGRRRDRRGHRREPRRPRRPVHDRQLVLDGGDAGQAGGAASGIRHRAREPPHGAPQPSHRRRFLGPGRAGRLDVASIAVDDQRRPGRSFSEPTARAPPPLPGARMTRSPLTAGRPSSRTSAGSPTTRAICRRLSLHRRSATGLRLRAPARLHRPGARRRRIAGARPERGLPAPRRGAGDHPSQQRGRLLGPVAHPALLAQRRPAEPDQRARADRQLPLQPVRPPLHRPAPATSGLWSRRRPAGGRPGDAVGADAGLTDCESDDRHGLLTPVSSL